MNISQTIFVIIIIVSVVIACFPKKNAEKYELRYDFSKPNSKMEMPQNLKEISGLSFYKDNLLACVNDEKGTVFIYDLANQKIIETIDIGKNGDYEDIQVVDDEIFIMKSNGRIKGFKINDGSEREINCSTKGVKEFEGLSYHPQTRSLLLITKEKDKEKNDKKTIYACSLNTEKFEEFLNIDEDMIKGRDGKKTIAPSGIAIHPTTNEIFVISSKGKKLLILSPKGDKNTLIELNPKTFLQPEGICFTPNGDLCISSEGANSNGYILKFAFF